MSLQPMVRGALLRCPACGKGRLFTGYNRIATTCSACEVDFHASPGEWTGAIMFAQGVFGFLALGGWYVLFLAGHAIDSAVAVVWLVGWGLILPILLYPSFKGAWIGAMVAAGGLDAPGENTRP